MDFTTDFFCFFFIIRRAFTEKVVFLQLKNET